jgi:hypothetical protein
MKVTFEIDTNDEDAPEYLKLINDKAKAIESEMEKIF